MSFQDFNKILCCKPGCCSAQIEKNTDCCSPGCCGQDNEKQLEKRKLALDFLYLDLSVCTRCQGTDSSVEEAIREVSRILEATGVELIINKIHIDNIEKAQKYQLVSSPTIRVNGKDIQLEVKESLCESCGDLCCGEVDCRVWVYQGKEYTVPPKGMIIDAILREIYTEKSMIDKNKEESQFKLPENLIRFFNSQEKSG